MDCLPWLSLNLTRFCFQSCIHETLKFVGIATQRPVFSFSIGIMEYALHAFMTYGNVWTILQQCWLLKWLILALLKDQSITQIFFFKIHSCMMETLVLHVNDDISTCLAAFILDLNLTNLRWMLCMHNESYVYFILNETCHHVLK